MTLFESRLDAALGRYADRVAVQVDVASVVQAATRSTRRRPLGAGWLTRTTPAAWLRLGIVVALLALAAVIAIAIAQQNRKPLHGGGRLLVGVRTTGWVLDPSLSSPLQVVQDSACQLVDGGTQLVYPGRFGTPTRIQPVGDDGSNRRGVTTLAIPGFGGTNMERWSPDGSEYALMRFGNQDGSAPADGPGALMVVSIHGGGDPVRRIFEIRGASGFAWSRDSRSIAAVGQNDAGFDLVVVDLVAGTQRVVASSTTEIGLFPGPAWTAGDSVISIVVRTSAEYRPALVSASGGPVRLLPDPNGLLEGPTNYAIWAPDGTRAILMGADGMVAGIAASGAKLFGPQRGTLLDSRHQFEADPWSPDSGHFALVAGSSLRIFDARGRAVGSVALPPAVEGHNPPVAWSPDGASIAIADATSAGVRLRILDAHDLHEEASTILPTNLDGALCFDWAPPVT